MKNNSNAYLTFVLGKEKFAIPVDYVQEVIEFGRVTKVPNAPDYMLGIVNLRGRILPLLDTRLKLGLPVASITTRSRIMVIDIQTHENENSTIGALVDVAHEVVEIQDSDIQDAPEFQELKTTAPITGIVNHQGDITMIMDIMKVFSPHDVTELNTSIN